MFNILKHIQPTWYFNLKPKVDHGYFPIENLTSGINMPLVADNNFIGEACQHELAFRANKYGKIDMQFNKGINWWKENDLSLIEEYKFARKHFHKARVLYACILRLLTFHNPVKEISAFLNTASTKRESAKVSMTVPNDYHQYESELIKKDPFVTIIIPTLNRYEYLNDVLLDLEKQNYKNFDVIVVDQSSPFRENFYERYKLNLKIIRQHEKALWLARNHAIKESKSEYLLLYDDDSRVENDWIHQHLKCIDYFKTDISSGVSISKIDVEVPVNYRFFRWSDQLDTGNVMIHRSVFKQIGLFDRQYEKQRMGDGEFGLRAYIAGLKNISNPLAKRLHLKVGEGGLRDMGHWDAFRPKSIWSPRPVPSVLYLYRKYYGAQSAIFSIIINLPPSIIPYQFKRNKKLLLAGSVLAIIFLPLVIFQVMRSWRKASAMLKNPMIEMLNE